MKYLKILLLLLFLLTGCQKPYVAGKDSYFQVTFLDVGQADAAIIECDGHFMMIDGGNVEDSDLIYTYLKENEIDVLDYIVASHAHEDHVGGLSGALSYADAEVILSPVQEYDSRAFQNFLKRAKAQGGLTLPEEGAIYPLGSATVEILGLNAGEENDSSIYLMVRYGNTSFLFTGDGEKQAEENVLDQKIKATVLKVGHHGSYTSSSNRFLEKVDPSIAIISVGKDNEFHHPHESTVNRLKEINATIYRTDEDGDILCTSDGNVVHCTKEKN